MSETFTTLYNQPSSFPLVLYPVYPDDDQNRGARRGGHSIDRPSIDRPSIDRCHRDSRVVIRARDASRVDDHRPSLGARARAFGIEGNVGTIDRCARIMPRARAVDRSDEEIIAP